MIDADGIAVVADGMGGYEGGEVASRIAVETIREVFRRVREDADATWPFREDPALPMDENLMLVAIRAAHGAIVAQKKGRLVSMGSTVAAVALARAPARAIIAHCGDSRVYRLRAGRLERMTRDHSYDEELAFLEELAGTGTNGPRERPFAHMVTRALGIADHGKPELRVEPLEPGDVLMICSDGLSGTLDHDQLAELLRAHATDPDGAARALVETAVHAGARDNVTTIVLRVE